jgi:hypothetical protein
MEVSMRIPEKKYFKINSLRKQWEISKEDMFYIVENGLLRATIWLPLRYVERIVMKNNMLIHECHEPKEGFVGLRPEDSRRVCGNGRAPLRTFTSVAQAGHILKLTDEPPQPSVYVRVRDMLILKEDRDAFEAIYDTADNAISELEAEKCSSGFIPSQDYHYIEFRGEEYHLGDFQARIIEQLHDASQSLNPWVHGKILIYDAGSKATRLRDLFKKNYAWEGLIVSNKKGSYRLNIPIKVSSPEKDPSAKESA